MIIGIISYLPKDYSIRQKRLEAHRKQLRKLKQYNLPIYIVAQNYTQQELDRQVNYIYIGNPLGPGGARNLLLDQFYNSDEDFMMLMDDDVYLYNYYDLPIFINEINTNPSKFRDLDYIRPIFAFQVPFKKTVYADVRNRNNYIFKDMNTINTTALSIIRNLRKYYNKRVFYTDMNTTNGEGYEDKDFCYQLKINGIKTHVLTTLICGSYNLSDNSSLFDSFEQRMSVHNKNNEVIKNKYANMTDKRGILLKQYRNYDVVVPRTRKLIISESLQPEDVNKGMLF